MRRLIDRSPGNKHVPGVVHCLHSDSSHTDPGADKLTFAMESIVKHVLRGIIAAVLVLAAPFASATFHTFEIDQIYSNADATVQYVVLHEGAGFNGQSFLGVHALTSTNGGATNTFPFVTNLPSTATAGKDVLIATQGFAQLGLVTPDYVIPNGFLPLTNGTLNYAGVDQVSYAALPTDGVSALNRSGMTVPNLATNFSGQSASVTAPGPAVNYGGLWWNSPAGSESGWGINFAHQGNIIFASWFTYDLAGKGLWLTMTAQNTAPGVYSGALYTTTGPAFNAVPFNPAEVKLTQVGTGTLTFSDANDGTFAYTVNGVSQMKSITHQVFGPLPVCATATASLAAATNYTDLWWAAPAGSESGWGINLTQEGETIFATWFTYDLDGTPMWLSATAANTAPGVFMGTLNRTTGPAFDAVPFNPANVKLTAVGTATFTFNDGNDASFAYTVNGISQTKAITRQVFQAPGTVCQ
jgi:hypothetical protein